MKKNKLYIQKNENEPIYWIIQSQNPLRGDLVLLDLLFESFNLYAQHIFVDKAPDVVFITQHFFGDDQSEDVVVKFDIKNYDYIMQKWQQVLELRPKYFILSRDDNGWIDLEMKNELSDEDQKYLDQDKIKKTQGHFIDRSLQNL